MICTLARTQAETRLKRRTANVLLDTLIELDVRTFYGIPGGAISPVYDALLEYPEVELIHTRHETGAMFMAAGHAWATGGLACVLTTSGPGITNAVTGLASAKAGGLPVIVIAGEVPRAHYGRGALQEGSRHGIDVLSIIDSLTVFAEEVSRPEAVGPLVRRAVAAATSFGGGPVALSLPLDVANQEAVPAAARVSRIEARHPIDREIVAETAERLLRAKRPLLLVGSGVRRCRAWPQLRRLATVFQIPVTTTPEAKGVFPESHPQALGIFGYGGHRSAERYLEEGVDTLVALGCGFSETSTNGWTEQLGQADFLIQLDIDPARIGKAYPVDLGVVGSVDNFLDALLEELPAQGEARRSNAGILRNPAAVSPAGDGLHPAHIMGLLQKASPAETCFTSDIGEHTLFALHHLCIDDPQGFLIHIGLGSMGSGIGSAIGIKAAQRDRPVVAVCGDYGFQMYGQELHTCVENDLGVVFAILNDHRMRMVEAGLQKIYGRNVPCYGPRIDFAAQARACGARGISLRSAGDFNDLSPDHFTGAQPIVLDIETYPDASFNSQGRAALIKNFRGGALA